MWFIILWLKYTITHITSLNETYSTFRLVFALNPITINYKRCNFSQFLIFPVVFHSIQFIEMIFAFPLKAQISAASLFRLWKRL